MKLRSGSLGTRLLILLPAATLICGWGTLVNQLGLVPMMRAERHRFVWIAAIGLFLATAASEARIETWGWKRAVVRGALAGYVVSAVAYLSMEIGRAGFIPTIGLVRQPRSVGIFLFWCVICGLWLFSAAAWCAAAVIGSRLQRQTQDGSKRE
jgi:hypothetical protein